MNAFSTVFEVDMGSISASAVDLVARYFAGLARSGKGCTTNNETIAAALGLSSGTVRAAKRELVRTRRLVGAWQTWVSIDGVKFGERVPDEFDAVKTILRRKFGPVFDVRTIANPEFVATGKPLALIVDGRTMTWNEAVALALAADAEERLRRTKGPKS